MKDHFIRSEIDSSVISLADCTEADIHKHPITVSFSLFFYIVVVSTVTLTLSLQRKYAVACRTSAA